MTQTKAELLQTRHQGDIRLGDADSTNYVGFKAPATVGSNLVWTLPAADGSASQYLQTNGEGVLTWSTVSVGGGSGIDFNDNVKARWGTGNDLEIFHNASNSVINDAGTGDLLLQVGGSTKATVSSTGFDITGALTVSTNAVITGNLTVSGTTTTINTQTLDVEDKNIEMGKVSSPSDTTADGGGITLKGATDKTINWINSTDAWTFSEHINIASGKKLGVGGANYGTSGQVLTSGGSSTHPSWTTISAAPQITATADGAIAAGQSVIMKSDGDVTKVTRVITVNNPPTVVSDRTQITGNNFDRMRAYYIPELKKIIVGGRNESSGDDMEVIVGEVDDSGAFTWGSITQITTDRNATAPGFVYDPDTERVILVYACDGMSSPEYSIFSNVLTVSGNSVTNVGTRQTLEAVDGYSDNGIKLVYDTTANKVVAIYRRGGGNNLYSAVGTVTGSSTNTIAWETPVSVASGEISEVGAVYDPDTNRIIATRRQTTTLDSYVGTVSGTSISWGSNSQIVASGDGGYHEICYDTENNRVVVAYKEENGHLVAKVGTVTGGSTNTISWGSESSSWYSHSEGAATGNRCAFDPYTKRVVVHTIGKGSEFKLLIASGLVSGSSITWTNDSETEGDRVTEANAQDFVIADKGRAVSIYRDFDRSNDLYSTSAVIGTGASNMTTGNFVGFASAAANDNATATVDVTGSTNSSQSGLTAGLGYYVQDDGTLGTTASDPEQFAGTALSATKVLVRGYPPAAAGAGEWTKLLSGDKAYSTGTHDLVEGFDTTYAAYKWFKIVWHFVGDNTDLNIGVRVKSGGSYIGNNHYNNQQWRQENGDDDSASNNGSNNGACARFHNTSFSIAQGETEFFNPMGTAVGMAFVSRSEGWKADSGSSTTGALGTNDRNHDMSIGSWGTNYGAITGLQWYVESGAIRNMYWVLYGRN